MNPVLGNNSSLSVHFLSTLQRRIDDGDDAVIDLILFHCKHVQNKEDAERVCILLFQVFSRLIELQLSTFLDPKSCLSSLKMCL